VKGGGDDFEDTEKEEKEEVKVKENSCEKNN